MAKYKALLKSNKEKEQMRDWIMALESGGIPQATGHLETSEGFCCLGVAVSMFCENPETRGNGTLMYSTPTSHGQAPGWLCGVNGHFQKHPRNKFKVRSAWEKPDLMALNDNARYKYSFKRIARALKEVYKKELGL